MVSLRIQIVVTLAIKMTRIYIIFESLLLWIDCISIGRRFLWPSKCLYISIIILIKWLIKNVFSNISGVSTKSNQVFRTRGFDTQDYECIIARIFFLVEKFSSEQRAGQTYFVHAIRIPGITIGIIVANA